MNTLQGRNIVRKEGRKEHCKDGRNIVRKEGRKEKRNIEKKL
jgi:hypothetical protein